MTEFYPGSVAVIAMNKHQLKKKKGEKKTENVKEREKLSLCMEHILELTTDERIFSAVQNYESNDNEIMKIMR